MSYLGMKQLLEAGVHFGHETKRWNPKMKRYIFAERNGIFIIDLQKTLVESEKAFDFLKDIAGRGGTILFVGTKKQAQEILAAEAKRCGMPFINERWLGGLLTNFKTIRTRVERLKELESMFEDETVRRYSKKEQIELGKELHRLQRYLGGIRDMSRLPDALFIIDPTKEAIAVKEANKLEIPAVALADTDSDPDVLDYIVPGNDDAIRSIQLVTSRLSDVIVEVRGGEDVPIERPLDEINTEDRETLSIPISSPERTIRAAAASAEGEEAEGADKSDGAAGTVVDTAAAAAGAVGDAVGSATSAAGAAVAEVVEAVAGSSDANDADEADEAATAAEGGDGEGVVAAVADTAAAVAGAAGDAVGSVVDTVVDVVTDAVDTVTSAAGDAVSNVVEAVGGSDESVEADSGGGERNEAGESDEGDSGDESDESDEDKA